MKSKVYKEYQLKNLVYIVKVGVAEKQSDEKISFELDDETKKKMLDQAAKNDPFIVELVEAIPKYRVDIFVIDRYLYMHYFFQDLNMLHLFYNNTKYFDKTFIFLPNDKTIKLKHMPDWHFDESMPPMLKIDEKSQTIFMRYF